MTIETITTLLYIWISISLVFPLIAVILIRNNRKLRKELSQQDLATRHYEEMLYASKDGYITYTTY